MKNINLHSVAVAKTKAKVENIKLFSTLQNSSSKYLHFFFDIFTISARDWFNGFCSTFVGTFLYPFWDWVWAENSIY